jgi:hypothetical protein
VSRDSVPSADAAPGLVACPGATRLLVLPRTEDTTKDLEILVLGHQLRVLSPQDRPPRFTTVDRVLLATASRPLPGDRWASFLVTPHTPLRHGPRCTRCLIREYRAVAA